RRPSTSPTRSAFPTTGRSKPAEAAQLSCPGQLRDPIEVRVQRVQSPAVLQSQGGDPDVIDGNWRSLPTELQLQLRVDVGGLLVTDEHPNTGGVHELGQHRLVCLATRPLPKPKPKLGQ